MVARCRVSVIEFAYRIFSDELVRAGKEAPPPCAPLTEILIPVAEWITLRAASGEMTRWSWGALIT